jgi:hypothetical protein
VTDPDLNAWYDDATGSEIGDVCNSANDVQPLDGSYVQTEWSNALDALRARSRICLARSSGRARKSSEAQCQEGIPVSVPRRSPAAYPALGCRAFWPRWPKRVLPS